MRELKQKTTFPISGFSPSGQKPGIKTSFPFLMGTPAGEGVFKLLIKVCNPLMITIDSGFFKIFPFGGMSEGQRGQSHQTEKAFTKTLCL